jgi:hypothetical protein
MSPSAARVLGPVAAILTAAFPLDAQGPGSGGLRSPRQTATDTTVVLAPEEPGDLVWLARDVLPLALVEESAWIVAVATEHSGMDGGEAACAYRVPWRATAVAGGLWIQHWAIRRNAVIGADELAAQVQGSPERCTPQPEVERRWAAVLRDLPGEGVEIVDRPNAVWRLAESATFGHDGRTFRVAQRVDSTATSRRTRVCFTSGGWALPRCLTVRTSPGANYQDRVDATVAVLVDRALWVFGLRTHGQRRGQPAWSAPAIAIKPIVLGRVRVGS